MKKFAVIAAGGSGTRMGGAMPKQFLLLNGKPLLWYSVTAFLQAYDDLEIILVLPSEHLEAGISVLNMAGAQQRSIATAGGPTRFQSVRAGLAFVREPAVVFVHDAARCLISKALIHRCYDAAVETGSAIPVVPAKDSLRLMQGNGGSHESLAREKIRLVQTPQTFRSEILLPAFQTEYREAFTDEATVVEAFGQSINLVEGDENNIKITTPADLAFAEHLFSRR